MKIGDQRIDRLEAVAGIDENFGLALHGMHDSIFVRYAFKHSRGRRTDGDDPAAVRFASIDALCRFGCNHEMLGVHMVLFDLVHLDRSEGAKPHVERDFNDRNALCAESVQNFRSEMQSRGRGGSRAFGFGVDGLITVFICKTLGNIRGKGHIPDNIQHSINIAVFFRIVFKPYNTVAFLAHRDDLSRQNAAELKARANLCALAGAHKGLPSAVLLHFKKQKLHRRACFLGHAEKTGGNDLGRVDDKNVAFVQMVHDIVEMLMRKAVIPSVKHEKAGLIPLFRRGLRDQLGGQLIRKISGRQRGFGSLVYNFHHIIRFFHIMYYHHIIFFCFLQGRREHILGKKYIFRGVGTAIVTPFYEGGIDYETFGRLLDIQTEYADAVIVAGTTGEAPTLSESERDELLAFAVARVDEKIPVIMGTGSNDTAHAVRLSRRASELGADGVLAVTPYYNRGTREGIRRHFLMIAEASTVPVILYNVPARTGGNLALDDYGALLPHPNILGIKEAEDNAEKFFALCEAFGDDAAIYTGNDAFLLPSLALGGAGVISVISNLYPMAAHAVVRAFVCGDIAGARRSFAPLFPLCRLLFRETSPAPVKEALRQMGFGNGECRLPLTPPSEALSKLLAEEISRLST